MNSAASYRQILRSSSIIGGASVANIGIGLLRMKVAAMLLGPAGIGLIGLMQSLVATAASVASVGLGMAGTRQVAEAYGRGDQVATARARTALVVGTLLLAAAGALVFWMARGLLAREVFAGEQAPGRIGWLALGVALSVAASSQSALLNGMRRIGDIARLNVWSALLSTAAGILALSWWGAAAIVPFVLAAPAATWLLGLHYVRRLPQAAAGRIGPAELLAGWRGLVPLGAALMLSGLAGLAGQLLVRTLVQRGLGSDALGQFQAAWLVSMTYIGFVLGAMATDYYPRLTAAIADRAAANRLVNEQAEVALLLATPAFMALLGLAPWVVSVLYTGAFTGAVDILRWQVMGDILKVASWPLSFVLLSAGRARAYLGTEVLAYATFALATWLGLPVFGVEAAGVGFLLMYAIQLPVVYLLVRRTTGFRWTPAILVQAIAAVAGGAIVALLSARSQEAGGVAGVALALGFGMHAFRRLGGRLRAGDPGPGGTRP